MLQWAAQKIQYFRGMANANPDEHKDIYGRVVERGEDFFHPQKFRGIPVFDVDSIIRHYTKQMDNIRLHFDIGDQRTTPEGDSLYEALVVNVVRRYIEFCHMVPASEDHHHSHTGGLLLHSLEASVESLRWAKERNPNPTGFVDVDYKVKPKMIYCAWLAGLLHDAGKLMRDISVDAVEVLDKHNNLVKPTTSIVSWYPAKESLLDWAKQHSVASYSVNFLSGRVHKRHNIDSSQILQPLLRGQYAMSYLLDTPIKQDIYNDLSRVLSGYTNNEDYLSESVRIGDSTSTSRSLGFLYDARLGSRPISTAQRLYRSVRTAAIEWEWNRPEGQGWIIANDVFIRWTSAIERVIKASQDIGYALPIDVKNVLNIMDSNQITDLYDRDFPDDRIVHFTPGKFKESEVLQIQTGEREVSWFYLLKLRGPQIIFSDIPVPYSQPGIVFLPKAKLYHVLDKDGDLLHTVALPEQEDGQQSPEVQKKKTQASAKAKKAKSQDKEQSAVPELKEVVIQSEPSTQSGKPGLSGIVFHNAPTVEAALALPEPANTQSAKAKSKECESTRKPTASSKGNHADTLSLILSHNVSYFIDSDVTLVSVPELETAFNLKQRALLSTLEKRGDLYIDLSSPSRKTVKHQDARGNEIKCIRLSKRLSANLQKTLRSQSLTKSSSKELNEQQDQARPKTDDNKPMCTVSADESMIAKPKNQTVATQPERREAQIPLSLSTFEYDKSIEEGHPTYQSLLHAVAQDSLINLLRNVKELHSITADPEGAYYIEPAALSTQTLKRISNAKLINVMRKLEAEHTEKGFRLSLKQIKGIKLKEVQHG